MRLVIGFSALLLIAATNPPPLPVEVPVTLTMPTNVPVSGRLLVFAEKAKPGDKAADEVDANPFAATPTAVAGRDISSLAQGQVATVDAGAEAYPKSWSSLEPGLYR